ncbi:MAG: glutamine synthetase family protein [Gammaproteobacteria bacterium]|nr:glutamine synthetase family protein [Gammaproteobacteria bacterium]
MTGTAKELARFIDAHPEVTHLDVLIMDLCANAIGKRLPASAMKAVFSQGSPVCGAMQLVDVMGNTDDPMGYGFSDGDPDAFALAIAGTLVPIPWVGGHKAQVLCEFRSSLDGEPLWYEPRQLLKKVLQRFESLRLRPRLAVELEFYLLDAARAAGGAPLPAVSPRSGQREASGKVLSLDKLDEFDEVLGAIETACRTQHIPTTSMISEYGAAQFEINLQHQDDALLAADHAALLRRAVQGVSRSLGYDASFMSKPFADQSGSGMHIHLSLLDEDGNNIFDPAKSEGDLRLGQAVAGLQATMGEAMALFAPNLNVYRRFKPDEFTPVTRDWGENNRSVAFRIPPSDGKNRRIEHRVAGAEANPYLVVAAVLAGVHHGLVAQLDPGARHAGNAGAEVDPLLPLTLWQALDSLRAAEILGDYLGEDYLRIYADVKQAEFDAFMGDILPREYDWYL